MQVSLEGFEQKFVTLTGANCSVGAPVKVGTGLKALNCSAGNAFLGVCTAVDDTLATVQVAGYASVPYSGTQPGVGYQALSADGAGGVQLDSGGRSYWVMEIDGKAMTIKILL
ncbi:MAG: hypothetical protein LUH51_02820 [Firmicutes bacterium]|nr:hypothetical protein [Bacillota bacterium]